MPSDAICYPLAWEKSQGIFLVGPKVGVARTAVEIGLDDALKAPVVQVRESGHGDR